MIHIGFNKFSGDILSDFHSFRNGTPLCYQTGNVIRLGKELPIFNLGNHQVN